MCPACEWEGTTGGLDALDSAAWRAAREIEAGAAAGPGKVVASGRAAEVVRVLEGAHGAVRHGAQQWSARALELRASGPAAAPAPAPASVSAGRAGSASSAAPAAKGWGDAPAPSPKMVKGRPSVGGSAHEDGVFPLDEPNARMLDLCAPRSWANPEPGADFVYDLIALGAGAGGLVSAKQSARRGFRSALVERHIAGGDCLVVGCVPSKALIRSARAARDARRQSGALGVRAGSGLPVEVDFAQVMRRMRELRARIAPADSFSGARALGVDVFQGEAVFVGPDSVRVGGQTLRFRRCVIATGARARLPELPGLDRVAFHTNATIFNLAELPRRLLVLGGGPISMELGQAFAALGSEVRVLLRGERPLSGEDPEAAALVRASLEEDGVAFSCGLSFESVEPLGGGGGGCRVRARDAGGAPVEFEGDCLLVSTGRQPNVQGLQLEAAGVAFSAEHGVAVDDELWTSNRSVLAVGDCVAQEYRYTHLSGTQAQMAVENALFGGHRRVSDLVLPHVTYTEPEVATVGLTEARARAAGVAVELYHVSLEHNDRAILDGATRGLARVLCRQGSDEIVGATIVADHAGEMISELALAIQFGVGLGPVRGIGALIHSYPTVAECVAGAAFQFKMKHWAKRHADGVSRATPYRVHHTGAAPSEAGQGLLGRASDARFSALHLAAACAATAAIVGALCARL